MITAPPEDARRESPGTSDPGRKHVASNLTDIVDGFLQKPSI